MAKEKFRFNSKTYQYEQVDTGFIKWLKRGGIFVLCSVVFALIIVAVSYPVLHKNISKDKTREIEKLEAEYALVNSKIEKLNTSLEVLSLKDDSIYSSIFGVEPLGKDFKSAGIGGAVDNNQFDGYSHSALLQFTNDKLIDLEAKFFLQQKSFDRIETEAKHHDEKILSIPAIQPIHNKNLIRTASGYGMRVHPIYKIPKMHWGIDFTAPTGTTIFATGNGTVKEVDFDSHGYGKHIVIDHGFGYQSIYAHLSEASIKKGDKVKRGDIIGKVGSTGTSTAPHLHYEVSKDGKKLDPANFFFNDLSYDEYLEIVKISSNINQSFD